MATESELKLRVKPEQLAKFKRLLKACQVTKPVTRRLHNVYFDTPEFDLHERKMALRLRRVGGKWLQTLKGGGSVVAGLHQRDEHEMEVPNGKLDLSLFGEDLSDEDFSIPLRKKLGPLFATDFYRTSYTIDWQGALIEVCLDRGEVRTDRRSEPICEVELELVSGEPLKLFELALSLLDIAPFELEMVSKAEKGFRLVTNFVSMPVKLEMPQEADTLTGRLQAYIWACLMHMQDNLHGAMEGTDPEYLHQMRVALRRLRVLLRICEKIHTDTDLSDLRDASANLGSRLGRIREWDVFSAQIKASHLGESGRRAISAYAANKRCEIFSELPFLEIQRLLLRFAIWMGGDYWQHAKKCEPKLSKFARRHLQKLHKRYMHARHLYREMEQLHALRIQAKKLRYSAELFSGLYEGKKVKSYLEGLGLVQESLGDIHDIIVAKSLLGEMVLPRQRKFLVAFEVEMDTLLSKKLKILGRKLSVFDQRPVFWK
jgi:triphosphatase